jgi:flagellar biosynthetic protein FliR
MDAASIPGAVALAGSFLAAFDLDPAVAAGVLMRFSAAAFFLPALGEPVAPARVRLAAVFAFTLIVAPGLAPEGFTAPAQAADWARLLGAEAIAGLIVGFTLRTLIYALQVAGAIAAQHIQLSQILGPGLSHDQESPLSALLVAAGMALAAALDGHLALAAAGRELYLILPLGLYPPPGETAEWVAGAAGRAISLGFALALPFVALGMVYSLALAAANRAMPQLSVAFVGAPAILLCGLTLAASALSVMLGRWSEVYARALANPLAAP